MEEMFEVVESTLMMMQLSDFASEVSVVLAAPLPAELGRCPFCWCAVSFGTESGLPESEVMSGMMVAD